jgi:hypothetical protein
MASAPLSEEGCRQVKIMNKQPLQQEREEQKERSRHPKQHVTIEWAKSEWFRIYLQMARRDPSFSGEQEGV